MVITVILVLALAAFICVLASAVTRKDTGPGVWPLWVAVFLLCVIELLRVLPLGK